MLSFHVTFYLHNIVEYCYFVTVELQTKMSALKLSQLDPVNKAN